MALHLATDADLSALPAGTEYRILSDRADLFAGRKVIEVKVKGLALESAPTAYPNGVKILDGCIEPWTKTEPKALATVDASELSVAISKLRETAKGEALLAELVKPYLAAEKLP